MCIPWSKPFSLVTRSSVMIKVKYQGHNFMKLASVGTFVFHKQVLFHHIYFLQTPTLGVVNSLPHNPESS